MRYFVRQLAASFVFLSLIFSVSSADVADVPELSIPVEQTGFDIKTLTLAQCYALALKQSENIAIDAEVIKEAEAHFLQALSTLLPHISFNSTEYRKDESEIIASVTGNERKFVFKQTLFSGFKELAAIKGSKSEKNQRIYEKQRAEQTLLVDVADAFFLLMQEREDLKTLHVLKIALLNRVKELNARERLGRSRKSEVVNTETQLYSIEAEIESVKSQEVVARQLLEFLVGQPVGPITDLDTVVPEFLLPESEYLAKVTGRPDVKAAGFGWDLSKQNIIVARSGFFPTITTEGNYYTHKVVTPTDSNWDAQVKIDVPIFNGTETIGNLKEAKAIARENELILRRTKRTAILDIRDSYERLESDILQTKAFKKALLAAEMNYYLQRDDYRLSLVNNLDVLAAMQSYGTTRRSYIQVLYATKRQYWQLRVAVGEVI